mgnify:CR=1 FL=1
MLIAASSLAAATFTISTLGWLQSMEWFVVDQFFRLRTTQTTDPRILIVTLDEPDINYVGEWPIPDHTLAKLLQTIVAAEPRGIGLDMYRNLPVGQGHEELRQVFENTPTLVGVEKVIEQPIGPPPGLQPESQVGMSDLVVDDDGRVRRALLGVRTEAGEHKYGLATQLAFNYLAQDQIYPNQLDKQRLQLGKATLRRFRSHDGGYANADAGGSQILINFPAGQTFFETASISAVLEGRVPATQMEDRIVLIGATATSLNDFFYTPMSRTQEMPGVFVHAHIVSHLLGAALDDRSVLNGIPLWAEGVWIVLSTHTAGLLVYVFLQRVKAYRRQKLVKGIWVVPCLGIGIISFSYGLFTLGLWVPVVAPLLSMAILSGLLLIQQNQKLQGLAAFDELTQIPNRRSFDKYLQECLAQPRPFTLVLCDVDYFKRYNDTYGHQEGDACLMAIATVLQEGVRQTDLAARYGGEEFALVLNNASLEGVSEILERIQAKIAALAIEHKASDVNAYVTLSFGVARLPERMQQTTPKALIESADRALYQAKQEGRNRFCSRTFEAS